MCSISLKATASLPGVVRPNVQDDTVFETSGTGPNSSKAGGAAPVEPPSRKGKKHGIDIHDNSAQYQQVMETQTNTSPTDGSGNSSSLSQPVLTKVGDDSNPGLNDSERTRLGYAKAAQRLQKALELGRTNWKGFTFSDDRDIPETVSQMHVELEVALKSWKVSRENPDLWSKAKHIAEQMFTATSPFFKNFLTVARSAQSV